MLARPLIALAVLALLSGCSHDDSYATPGTTAPYADLVDSPIRGLTQAEIDALRAGSGMQLALPAELNGFPGPKHVLELADPLGLNASQLQAVQQLYDATNAAARAGGEDVLKAYEAVDQWFRNGGGPSSELDALMSTLGEREAHLRGIHLQAHVDCKALLTAHQVELYKDLRGYGGSHTGHAH
jgi:hypothetical protein